MPEHDPSRSPDDEWGRWFVPERPQTPGPAYPEHSGAEDPETGGQAEVEPKDMEAEARRAAEAQYARYDLEHPFPHEPAAPGSDAAGAEQFAASEPDSSERQGRHRKHGTIHRWAHWEVLGHELTGAQTLRARVSNPATAVKALIRQGDIGPVDNGGVRKALRNHLDDPYVASYLASYDPTFMRDAQRAERRAPYSPYELVEGVTKGLAATALYPGMAVVRGTADLIARSSRNERTSRRAGRLHEALDRTMKRWERPPADRRREAAQAALYQLGSEYGAYRTGPTPPRVTRGGEIIHNRRVLAWDAHRHREGRGV
jgi:hypothetical protein